MKCQILLSGENKKNIIILLSAALAQGEVKVNRQHFKSVCLILFAGFGGSFGCAFNW